MLGPTGLRARGAHAGVTCGLYINIHMGTPGGVSAMVSGPNYIHIKCPSSGVKFKAHSLQSEKERAFGLTPSTLQRPCLPPLVGTSKGCPQAWRTISHTGARTGRCAWHPDRYLGGWRLIPSNSVQGSAAAEPGSGQTLSPTPSHCVDTLCAAGRRWAQDTRGTRTHRTGHT